MTNSSGRESDLMVIIRIGGNPTIPELNSPVYRITLIQHPGERTLLQAMKIVASCLIGVLVDGERPASNIRASQQRAPGKCFARR